MKIKGWKPNLFERIWVILLPEAGKFLALAAEYINLMYEN